MQKPLVCLMVSVFMWVGGSGPVRADMASKPAPKLLRVYGVNKKVSDFPEKRDFSTPEAAYAVINRVMASGDPAAWPGISVKTTARRFSPADTKRREVKPEIARMWLDARILEVRIFKGRTAVVLAEIKRGAKPSRIDKRFVALEGGRWLNRGQDGGARSLEDARAQTNGKFAWMMDRPVRPKVEDPAAYLKPFVQFLKDKADEPKSFLMKALSQHKLVIMGEVHHRPRYWAFNASLVTDPDFPKRVGVIYMELPPNDQHLVEKFLAAKECNTTPIIKMLRDVLWMGWPDQAMLDFFMTVWAVNQDLPPEKRLRIVLVDMQSPWDKIKSRRDWPQYEMVSRDRQMADNITADLRKHSKDSRNALFIVGVGHAGLNLKYFEGAPVLMAGRYLRKELGPDKVYAIFPHEAVGTNWGGVDGRLCLGLFDSAFAALDNKPMAFPLDVGPFGKQPFDAFSDRPVQSSYRDGYSAYLYLGPLEYEIFSPLIAGFYTDKFVKELDRRHRMMYGQGLVERCRLKKLDGESFVAWMRSWGKPRRKWRRRILGPLDAWRYGGSDWQKTVRQQNLRYAREHPEVIVNAARELFAAIRRADYDNIQRWKKEPDAWKEFIDAEYCVGSNYPGWVKWICENFKDNPIKSVELGDVSTAREITVGDGKIDVPAISYKLTLKDGTVLKGVLPFDYDAVGQRWGGRRGIDWHVQYKSGLKKAKPAPR